MVCGWCWTGFSATLHRQRLLDRYLRFDTAGNLNQPGIGTDDDSGACEAGASPYYPWYYFTLAILVRMMVLVL
jgi:hypothetical protein